MTDIAELQRLRDPATWRELIVHFPRTYVHTFAHELDDNRWWECACAAGAPNLDHKFWVARWLLHCRLPWQVNVPTPGAAIRDRRLTQWVAAMSPQHQERLAQWACKAWQRDFFEEDALTPVLRMVWVMKAVKQHVPWERWCDPAWPDLNYAMARLLRMGRESELRAFFSQCLPDPLPVLPRVPLIATQRFHGSGEQPSFLLVMADAVIGTDGARDAFYQRLAPAAREASADELQGLIAALDTAATTQDGWRAVDNIGVYLALDVPLPQDALEALLQRRLRDDFTLNDGTPVSRPSFLAGLCLRHQEWDERHAMVLRSVARRCPGCLDWPVSSYGCSLLRLAIEHDRPELALAVAEAGAQPDVTPDEQWTPPLELLEQRFARQEFLIEPQARKEQWARLRDLMRATVARNAVEAVLTAELAP